jgi:chromosome segregation ATPase
MTALEQLREDLARECELGVAEQKANLKLEPENSTMHGILLGHQRDAATIRAHGLSRYESDKDAEIAELKRDYAGMCQVVRDRDAEIAALREENQSLSLQSLTDLTRREAAEAKLALAAEDAAGLEELVRDAEARAQRAEEVLRTACPDKHYWSDEYVEKLHNDISELKNELIETTQRADQSDAVSKVERTAFFSANQKLADTDKALEICNEQLDDAQNIFAIAEVRAQRAAKEMRERCAKVCETVAKGAHKAKRLGASGQSIEQVIRTGEDLAKAIRALPVNESVAPASIPLPPSAKTAPDTKHEAADPLEEVFKRVLAGPKVADPEDV